MNETIAAKNESKDSSNPDRHFTEHLTDVFEEPQCESNTNQETSEFFDPVAHEYDRLPPTCITLERKIDKALQAFRRAHGVHNQRSNTNQIWAWQENTGPNNSEQKLSSGKIDAARYGTSRAATKITDRKLWPR
jgi:hypothetical protein